MVPRAIRAAWLLSALALAGSIAGAQATWTVESLIPEVISVRVPTTTIAFDVGGSEYPPEAFPARYPATSPAGGVLPVQVHANAEGTWSLLLQVPDMRSEAGTTVIAARQILFRIEAGPWLRADGTPQVVYTQRGATDGWDEIRIEFALELEGRELAGAYRLDASLTASIQPGF